jgi:hypothetical protein
MSGAIPPLPHRDDFTFTLPLGRFFHWPASRFRQSGRLNERPIDKDERTWRRVSASSFGTQYSVRSILNVRGPFEKFVDSHYYSESELCGGAVPVSFSKYLLFQAMHFLQRSTHFSKTCCRPLITSKLLTSELRSHGWKSPEISWGEIGIEFYVRLGKSGPVEPH